MDNDRFTVDDALAFSWERMKRHFAVLLGIVSVTWLMMLTPAALGFLVGLYLHSDVDKIFSSLVFGLICAILHDIVDLGMINVQLKLCRDESASTKDVFSALPHFWSYVLATIIYKTSLVVGYICFIVPGVWVQLSWQFYGYLIVERGLGPIQALKESAAITKGSKLNLLILGIVLYFINCIGAMSFMILALPAYMICVFATVYAYRRLAKDPAWAPNQVAPQPGQGSA